MASEQAESSGPWTLQGSPAQSRLPRCRRAEQESFRDSRTPRPGRVTGVSTSKDEGSREVSARERARELCAMRSRSARRFLRLLARIALRMRQAPAIRALHDRVQAQLRPEREP